MGMHRLLVGLVGINAVLLAALAVQGHRVSAVGDPGTVRARAIELIDGQGRLRAQLNVEDSGETVFRLRDATGEIRVKIGAGKDGSGLLLLDESAEPGIQMLAQKSGTHLTLASRNGQRRVITP